VICQVSSFAHTRGVEAHRFYRDALHVLCIFKSLGIPVCAAISSLHERWCCKGSNDLQCWRSSTLRYVLIRAFKPNIRAVLAACTRTASHRVDVTTDLSGAATITRLLLPALFLLRDGTHSQSDMLRCS
jgi:hypothetical protein